jgi:Flp pilus assembly pilin Flp
MPGLTAALFLPLFNLRKESSMKTLMINLIRDEQGQDLIEYTLLLAFVALASAALFIGTGGSVNTIWSAASNNLTNAANSTS